MERRRRIYFRQQWSGLANEAVADTICDRPGRRPFAGLDRSVGAVPAAATRLNFRHLLEAHALTRRRCEEVGALLGERK